jgi:pimeloyl-ACP methyl ester carboxylesterase
MNEPAPHINAKVVPGPDRVVLLLHGWGQSLQSMLPMGQLLAGVATIHALDLPGFGASEPPPKDWDTFAYAKRVLAYLDEQGIARADLMGHSFGGRVAVQMAAHWPDRVRSIVLIGAAGLRPRRTFRQRLRVAFSRWLGKFARMLPGALREPLLRWREGRFGSRDFRAAPEPLKSILSRVVAEDLQAEARRIRAPALLLWGRNDTETPVEMGERYAGLIAGSRMLVLEDHDHFPFVGAGAHLCATHIKGFLATVLS